MGIDIPRRRFTLWAAGYFAAFFCVPLRAAFGFCYGIVCWLG